MSDFISSLLFCTNESVIVANIPGYFSIFKGGFRVALVWGGVASSFTVFLADIWVPPRLSIFSSTFPNFRSGPPRWWTLQKVPLLLF